MSDQAQPRRATDRGLSAEQLDVMLGDLDALPTLPSVLAGFLALAPRSEGDSASGRGPAGEEELVEVLRSDVSLAARVLSLANQARPGAVRSVGQAVAELGPKALRSAVLCTPLLPPRRLGGEAEGGLAHPEFRRHCVAVAVAAEMLVRRMGAAVDPGEAFACGLLHDLGKLALDAQMPKTYRRVVEAARAHGGNIADYERQIIGVDHCVAGRRLAERWQLPRSVRHVAWLAHQPIEVLPASLPEGDRLLVGVVGLADTLARERELGFSGNFTFPRSSGQLADQLGLGREVLADVADRLPGELAARYELPSRTPDSDRLCARVLAEANAELGRLNEQLRRRAEDGAARAEAFGHFRRFAEGLGPDATVGELLVRVAETIALAAQVEPSPAEPIIAYAVGDEDSGVLAVRHDGTDRPAWRTFDAAGGEDVAAAPAASAGAEEVAGRLLADPGELSDWVDVSACAHRPLAWAGSWVGGVLYRPPRRVGGPEAGRRQVLDAVVPALALAVSMAQARTRAMRLGEQLAGASQVLAATQDALAEAKTLAAMEEMAGGAGHELNNPLAVIHGRAQVMCKRADSEAERATWQLVVEQAQQISDIISALMEVAHPPQPTPEALDVGEILAQAVQSFRSSEHAKARQARVDIEVELDVPPALADRRQVQAVIEELLTNAATAAGSQPQIRLSAEADEVNGAVLLTVRDDGPGMDQQTLESVFTPFFSSQRAGRRRGLGLPRAKRYIETNGGRLWIRTQPGEGTTVYVQLPPHHS